MASPTKFLFTLSLLTAVVVASTLALARDGRLSPDWSSNLAIAPHHIAAGQLFRLITSVFLTHDTGHLVIASAMILAVVGWCEHVFGTPSAFWTFGLSHLIAMFVFAFGLDLIHRLHFSQTVAVLYSLRDVGPSAGYYGCLGRVLLAAEFSNKMLVVVGLVGLLIVRIVVSIADMPQSQVTLSSDIVHLLATIVGMLICKVVPEARNR